MATLKRLTRRPRGESLRGSFMIDTVRGVLRVRKWPRKRGTPKSALQRQWNEWFKQANYLAKYVDGATAARAIEITAGSGMYPRDIILSAMRGRLYRWIDQNGKVWNSMAAVQDISDSLDVLAQTLGDVLVRASDRWRKAGPPTPTAGHVLTYQDALNPPLWQAGGGGLQQIDLPGTPFVPDGTVNNYVFDVTAYAETAIILDAVTLSASQQVFARVSVDDGVSYKSGGADYFYLFNSAGFDASGNTSVFNITSGNSASNHRFVGMLTGIQTTRALLLGHGAHATSMAASLSGATRFAGPITHVKLLTSAGANFTGGTIALMGKTT